MSTSRRATSAPEEQARKRPRRTKPTPAERSAINRPAGQSAGQSGATGSGLKARDGCEVGTRSAPENEIKRALVDMLAAECPDDAMPGQSGGRVTILRAGRTVFVEIAPGRTVREMREFADRVAVARGKLVTVHTVADIRVQLGALGLVRTAAQAKGGDMQTTKQ